MKILKIIGGLLALLLVIFFLAGLVVPKVTYDTEIVIDRPLSPTFELFNDLEKISEWIPEIASVEAIKETPNKVGSQYKMKVVSGGSEITMTETVTEYVEDQKVSLNFDAGDMFKIDTYSFTGNGNQTTISSNHSCEGQSYFHKCMFAFFKSMFKNIDQGYLENFKKYAETTI